MPLILDLPQRNKLQQACGHPMAAVAERKTRRVGQPNLCDLRSLKWNEISNIRMELMKWKTFHSKYKAAVFLIFFV